LIGWVGGVTHVIDVGAVGPGSMSNGQVQRFGDGVQITCRKTGINDTPLRDWLHESQRNVRTPKYWILDEKTRIAGCHMIRDLVEETVREEGLAAYTKFATEVIEDGRRGLISRIKAMTIPGKIRTVAFVDVPYMHEDVVVPPFAKIDTIMHAPCEITVKPDATWRLDFEGCSRWGWHTYNANPVAFTSGIWVMMTQSLVPTERINDGARYATEFRMPKGTWTNPDDRRTAHADAWHFLVSSWSSLWRGVSRTYFGRGYLEEVNAGNAQHLQLAPGRRLQPVMTRSTAVIRRNAPPRHRALWHKPSGNGFHRKRRPHVQYTAATADDHGFPAIRIHPMEIPACRIRRCAHRR